MDDFGFVESVDGLCQCLVIRVTDAADSWLDASRDACFGVS